MSRPSPHQSRAAELFARELPAAVAEWETGRAWADRTAAAPHLKAALETLFGGVVRGTVQSIRAGLSLGEATLPAGVAEKALLRLLDALRPLGDAGAVQVWAEAVLAVWRRDQQAEAQAAAEFENPERAAQRTAVDATRDLLQRDEPTNGVDAILRAGGRRLDAALGGAESAADTAEWRALSVAALVGLGSPGRRELLAAVLDLLVDRQEAAQRYSGEFATSPALARLLTALAAPRPGERVVDPACGRGTLLAACVAAQPGVVASGVDRDAGSVLVAAARVVLAGGDPSGLGVGDALADAPVPDADVVVLDPPLGLKLSAPYTGVLGETGTDGDAAFLQAALERLKPGGRAVVIVPAALLSRDRLETVRRTLLVEFAVDAVMALPQGLIKSTGVELALLCMSRREPHDDVWFVHSRVLMAAMSSDQALAPLVWGAAFRRGEVEASELRGAAEEAQQEVAATSFFYMDEAERLTASGSKADADEEFSEMTLWQDRYLVASVVADSVLPEGWVAEFMADFEPSAGLAWREPTSWLLEHDASLAVRQTGERELQALLREVYDASARSAATLPLADVAEVWRGRRFHAEDTAEATAHPRGTLYVRVGDVRDEGVRRPDRVLVSTPRDARRLRAGDLLVTLSGSVGRVARVPEALDGAVASADLAIVRSADPVRLDYLRALLWTVPYQRWLHGHATGATIQHLTIRELRALPTLLPSEEDQRRLIAGLRPGDDHGRIAALLRDDEENAFVLALATEPLLASLEAVDVDDRAAVVDQAVGLQNRLWELAEETGAVTYLKRLDIENRTTTREAYPSGRADDPFAEWMVKAQHAFTRVADAFEEYGGAERLVVLDTALADLRRATRRLGQGLTELDEMGVAGPEVRAGLLFPFPHRQPSSHKHVGLSQEAVARADAALRFGERVRDAAHRALVSPDVVQLEARIEPDAVEIGQPTDVLFTLENRSPVTVLHVRVRCRLREAPEGQEADGEPSDAFPRAHASPDLTEVVDVSSLPADRRIDGVLRLPPQAAAGARRVDAWVSFTHLDGAEHHVRLAVPIQVRGLREVAGDAPVDFGASPYVLGAPVRDETLFFGRRGVLAQIYEQLDRPGQANLILLEGNRRSGKSSVLRRLEGDASETLPGWVVANSSFQEGQGAEGRSGLPTREVYYRIALNAALAIEKAGYPVPLPGSETADTLFRTRARKALAPFFDEAGEHAADALRELLTDWLDGMGGARLLLLLDEFDKIDEGIQSGVTSPQVPETLRALFQQEPRLSAVLAVFPRVTRMRQGYWSALFGLGKTVRLGPLEPDEALALVQEPVRGRLRYEGEAAPYLVGQCGRQPYLVQMLADSVFANRAAERRSDVSVDVVEKAARAFAANSEHLSGLWDVVGSDRRRLVLALVHRLSGGTVPVTFGVLEAALEEEGVRLPDGEELGRDHLDALVELELVRMDATADAAGATYTPATLLMGRWILAHVDPADLRARAQSEVSR